MPNGQVQVTVRLLIDDKDNFYAFKGRGNNGKVAKEAAAKCAVKHLRKKNVL